MKTVGLSGSVDDRRFDERGWFLAVCVALPAKRDSCAPRLRAWMGWAASCIRVVRAGGAFGRKSFREAGAPGVREGEMCGRGAPSGRAALNPRADRGLDLHPLPFELPGTAGNYSESELEEWAQRIERWRRDHDVYAYFNNDREGFAVRNALRLKERLGV